MQNNGPLKSGLFGEGNDKRGKVMCKQFTVAKLETPPNAPRFAGDARQSWGFAGTVIYISSLRGSYFSYVEENTAFKTAIFVGLGFFFLMGGFYTAPTVLPAK